MIFVVLEVGGRRALAPESQETLGTVMIFMILMIFSSCLQSCGHALSLLCHVRSCALVFLVMCRHAVGVCGRVRNC